MPRPTPETVQGALRRGRVLLASASPRRREILLHAGVEFQTAKPPLDEALFIRRWEQRERGAPRARSRLLRALVKAKWESLPVAPYGQLVLCFDTMVHDAERLYGKPADLSEARRFLRSLSGRTHRVSTACLVAMGSWCAVRVWTSEVSFRILKPAEIEETLRVEPALDAAGAYKIQGMGLSYIQSIRGDYHNVVGLPLPFLAWLRQGCP